MHFFSRPELLMVAFVLSIGLLIGLMFKRKEHPTNMYLLLAFVSDFLEMYGVTHQTLHHTLFIMCVPFIIQ